MKNFETPEIMTLDLTQTEAPNPASGPTEDRNPYKGDFGCSWTITTNWENHNGGSHSELKIKGQHAGKGHGNGVGGSVECEFVCIGFELGEIVDKGGFPASIIGKDRFKVIRTIGFNETENFAYNIQITAKDSKYSGAIADTNDKTTEAGKYVICVSCVEKI